MVKILISGASGFIGKALVSYLASKNHSVFSLSRNQNENSIHWDPKTQSIELEKLEGFDVIIHLAGERLELGRWSKEKKDRIYQSRIDSTRFLVSSIKKLTFPPKLFISASAVGYYGDQGEDRLDEKSPCGNAFLSKVCKDWEEASEELKERGSRVCHTRFGMVIGKGGGAIPVMRPIYQKGLGACLGSGKQWLSWIHLDDLVRAMEHVIEHQDLEGAINFTSESPVRQIEFSKKFARLLHKPHFLWVPKFVIQALFGKEASEMLLMSTKVIPSKLIATKFSFEYPDLRSALNDALSI